MAGQSVDQLVSYGRSVASTASRSSKRLVQSVRPLPPLPPPPRRRRFSCRCPGTGSEALRTDYRPVGRCRGGGGEGEWTPAGGCLGRRIRVPSPRCPDPHPIQGSGIGEGSTEARRAWHHSQHDLPRPLRRRWTARYGTLPNLYPTTVVHRAEALSAPLSLSCPTGTLALIGPRVGGTPHGREERGVRRGDVS